MKVDILKGKYILQVVSHTTCAFSPNISHYTLNDSSKENKTNWFPDGSVIKCFLIYPRQTKKNLAAVL